MRLARAFAPVPRVDISIDCIVEDQMGCAFVDSVENPTVFMVEQGQFFCYFAGEFDAGREFVRKTPGGRLLMAGSQGWGEILKAVFGERLVPIKRYRFSSESLSHDHLKHLADSSPQTANIRRIDATLAGTKSDYLDIGAFESPDDFVERGIGFCMMKDTRMIGAAYASLACSDAIEISIVVDPEHRKQGIATALSCQLLLWCLEHTVEPHWDAANAESCSLAEKLGYSDKTEYVAYYLKGD
jgi:GNAT superfamily N-acetyltransferase